MRKSIRKSVRFEPEQFDYIENQMNKYGMNLSVYIRTLVENESKGITKANIKKRTDLIISRQLINEINHIGVNINQIVKNFNSGFYSQEEKKSLEILLARIYDILQQSEVKECEKK